MDSSKDVKGSRVTGQRERVNQTILIRKQKRMAELKRRRQNKGGEASPDASPAGIGPAAAAAAAAASAAAAAAAGGIPGLPPAAGLGGKATVLTPANTPGGVGGAAIELQHLDAYVQGVNQDNEDIQLDCTRKIRKLLSKEDNPPAREIIDKGLVPVLVEFLKRLGNPKLQFEAAWALTNIASTEHTECITRDEPPYKRNAVPYLAQLMRSPNPDVREQSCWCLGNVAGDGSALRDIVLGTPHCLDNLILNINKAHNESMLKNATWALSNFCRGKPQPAIHVIEPALHILGRLITVQNDEVLRDACWAFSYISDGDDDRIQAVLNVRPLGQLVLLLGHAKSAVVTPALRSLGNIISGNDQQTQLALDAGALQALVPLLRHEKVNIQKEACWTLSNIAAGTPQQARQLVQAVDNLGFPVISKVIELANGGHYDVRKEAAWVLANVCTGGDVDNIRRLVESKPTSAIHALCNLLTMDDPRMLLVGLEALEAILGRGEPREGGQSYEMLIEQEHGVEHLELLQESEDEEIYQKASHILSNYFAHDSDDDESGDEDHLVFNGQ
jgi:importin subunit alpha-1